MQLRLRFISSALLAALPALLSAQTAPAPATRAIKGLPARAVAADYAGHGPAGAISIGADFNGHTVPTNELTLNTEDYVTVEVGIFGAPGARATISANDFSLRINGKKSPIPVEGFAALTRNLRDPSWLAAEEKPQKEKSKGGINTGGGEKEAEDSTPRVIHVPPELERAWSLQTQSAALPEGDRALPVAGLIFFKYGGQSKGIREVELVYAGAAGKASIVLQR